MTQSSKTADAESAPNRIGPYRLARLLGRGGMGEVFLAWDERLGRRVAVKRLLRGHPRDRERLRREAKAAARLSHPSVVQIHDLLEDPAGDAIVFEYVEGRTLREILQEGLPAPAASIRLAREIAGGLAAAHAAGLVHRDLKAENVMVTPDGHAKILDFGIAKAAARESNEESLTAQGVLVGTLCAMSPEQARGGEIGPRSDLFSLGTLLYELLTGRSPFRGATPLDTLQRIADHQPPPVHEIRPEVPVALSGLVGRLLAKNPDERPASASEVARSLDALSRSGPPDEAREAVGEEEATLISPMLFVSAPAPNGPQEGSGRSYAPLKLRRTVGVALAAALLLLFAFGAGRLRHRPAPPLRVVVLAPRLPLNATADLRLAASAALEASLSALGSLDGIVPLDPTQAGTAASPTLAARAAAAGEVLVLALEPHQEAALARLSLRRTDARDGRVLWAGGFPVPVTSQDRDLRLLADAVAVHLRRAWPGRELRRGTPKLEVRNQDYAELLEVKERFDRGDTPLGPELKRLERIARGSPRFLEAHLLLSRVAASLFTSSRDPAHLARALEAARAARMLAPGDPRPATTLFLAALAGHRRAEARQALDALTAINPSDPQLHGLAGRLAESEGDLKRAAGELEAAARLVPSWSNLFRLANLEIRDGRIPNARRHLEQLLARDPDNLWGMDKLGNLELLEGDPARAEHLYLRLIRRQPQRSFYTNLGLARSLLGRPAEAVQAYRKALELSPGHAAVLLNLADAELALGRGETARAFYSQALDRLAATEHAAGLSPAERMARAQCLAHLGHIGEAVELTQTTLRASGDDPEVLYQASLVYALAGDRASALVNARLALGKGIQKRWFTLPSFGPLREDPALRTMLQG